MAFVEGKQPLIDKRERKVYLHAPEVKWEAGEWLWELQNYKARSEDVDRNNCQIAIQGKSGDAVSNLSYILNNEPLFNGFQTMHTRERVYEDDEWDLFTIRESDKQQVDSVYIVASVMALRDLESIMRLADHYKFTLGIPEITGVFSFLTGTRQDKNVKMIEESEIERYSEEGEVYKHEGNYYIYDPKALTIRKTMRQLSGCFDRLMVVEPHSSATQAFAFEEDLPVLPISPWLWMIEQCKKDLNLNKEDWVIVRPDEGRNIASERLADFLGLERVSCVKTRLGQGKVSLSFKLEDKIKVQGKRGFAFDDEISTGSTYDKLKVALKGAGAIDLTAMYVHPKFIGTWMDNMSSSFISQLIGTNSRLPIGALENLGDRSRTISLAPFLLDLIKADINEVNFWEDERYRQMILQTQPEER